jgi:hypothetical protein
MSGGRGIGGAVLRGGVAVRDCRGDGASAGLLSSPELTVAAVVVAGWAMIRLVVKLHEARGVEETR